VEGDKEERKEKMETGKERELGEKDSRKTMKGRYKKNDKIMSNDNLYKKDARGKVKNLFFSRDKDNLVKRE
jgi:hypothetical protein